MAMERCPQCARPVEEGAASCSTCGYPLARDPAGVRHPADVPTQRVSPVDAAAEETTRIAYTPSGPERGGQPVRERPLQPRRDSGLPTWALALLALALLSVGAWYFLFARDGGQAAEPGAPATSAAPTVSASSAPSPSPSPSPSTYEVQAGDTLSVIAQRFGVTTEALAAANEITDPNRITLGQVLVIPPETTTVQPQVSASPSTGG